MNTIKLKNILGKLSVMFFLSFAFCFSTIKVKANDDFFNSEGTFDDFLLDTGTQSQNTSTTSNTSPLSEDGKKNPATSDNNTIYLITALVVSFGLVFVIRKLKQSIIN